MSTVTQPPSSRRVITPLRNTVIYEVVQAEELQTPPVQEAEIQPEPGFQENMEGVEESRQVGGQSHVGDQEITLN